MIEITDHHDGLFRLRQGPAISFIFSKADGEHMASQLRDLGMLPVSPILDEDGNLVSLANQDEQRIAHIKTRQLAFERMSDGTKTVEQYFDTAAKIVADGNPGFEWSHQAVYLGLCGLLGIAPNPNLYPPEMESFLDQL